MPDDCTQPSRLIYICMVEVSGTSDQVLERLERIEQLVQLVADGAKDRLAVSLISYGPHSVDRGGPEVPLRVLTWAGGSDAALAALSQLRDAALRNPVTPARRSSNAC